MPAEVYLRTGSPYYWFRVTDPLTGQQIARSTKRRDEEEAKLVRATWLRERLDQKQFGYKATCTLGEALDAYVEKLLAEGSTWDIESIAKKLKGQMEGRSGFDPMLPMHMLTTVDVERHKTKRLKEGASRGTVNLEIKALRAAMYAAKSKFRINDELEFKLFKVKPKKRILTDDEEAALLRELDPNRTIRWKDRFGNEGRTCKVSPRVRRQMQDIYDIVVLLFDTAARYYEIGSLPWPAVDTKEWQWIYLRRRKVEDGDREMGRLAITDRMREVLQRRWAERRNSPYVFEGYAVAVNDQDDDEEREPRGKSTRPIRKAMQRAGINSPDKVLFFGKATTHSIRHTCATWWLKGNEARGISKMDISEVQILLGHASITQTEEYLTHDDEEVAKRAAEKLNARRRKKPAEQPSSLPAEGLAALLGGLSEEQLTKVIAVVKAMG